MKLKSGGFPKGLVSYWTMDNVSGNTLIDETGNNNGTIYGATQVDGKINKALSFDGVDDYVDCGDKSDFDFSSNDFTLSAWVYPMGQVGGWTRNIITKWNTGSNKGTNEFLLSFYGTAGGTRHPIFAIESGTTTYSCDSPEEIPLKQWSYILGKREGDYLHIYVNGVLKNSTYIGNVSVNNVGRSLNLGRLGISGYYFNGSIDEVMIFNRALSLEEINKLYKRGLSKIKLKVN